MKVIILVLVFVGIMKKGIRTLSSVYQVINLLLDTYND